MDGEDDSRGETRVDRLILGGATGVVGRCRRFLSESLAARGWLDNPGDARSEVVEDVLLMASELVTNACMHAGGPLEVVVSETEGRLRVEVADAGDELPVLRILVPLSRPSGHGLRVVERLAHRWGSSPRPGGGKVVWFEVARA